jgi:Domain of unknown function (DUF3331)
MNDGADDQRWLHMLAALAPMGSLPVARDADARWASVASSRKRRDVRRNSVCVEVLERLSSTSVVISWADATSGRYGEQTWILRVARCKGVCPLSGEPFPPGAPVYRPNVRQRRVGKTVQPIAAATIERLERGEPARRVGG